MKIAVDAMGGDNAPEAVVCGAIRAAQAYHEEIILVGQEDKIRAVLQAKCREYTGDHRPACTRSGGYAR